MAYSHTFVINKEEFRNQNCFGQLTSCKQETQYIVIENNKLYFSYKQTVSYLRGLKSMGYKFTFKYDKKSKSFLIYTSQLEGRLIRVSFFMAIRCLWEGTYNLSNYDKGYDLFINIVEHYFNLKKYFKRKFSNLQYLCLANNCFLSQGLNHNYNHSFAIPQKGCKIISNLNEMSGNNVNSTMSLNVRPYARNYPKPIKDWNINHYKNIINELYK